ncbi:MAG: hypothetical protein ACJ8F7_15975 [Gemmataceae bacterium]
MKRKAQPEKPRKVHEDDVPPGATKRAFNRENLGGGPEGSPLGDRHAVEEDEIPGGTEYGGLAGSNVGDGTPLSDEGREHEDQLDQADGPYAGHAGGAVGGSPAEGRATGQHAQGGFSPGSGSSRGDSTVGAKPTKAKGGRKKKTN